MPKQPVIVFDVNETLLDLDALHPTLDRVFGDPAALRLWFAHLITYSEALTSRVRTSRSPISVLQCCGC